MQWTQISGIVDRILIGVLTYVAAKGYISNAEVANIAAALVTILGAVWGAWVNRPKAVVQAAAAMPGTTVVTTAALASNTTEKNIVPNTASSSVISAAVDAKDGKG